jgi:hypothetical protein
MRSSLPEALLFLLTFVFVVPAVLLANDPPANAERWGIYEVSLQGLADGNPFTKVWLRASFSQGPAAGGKYKAELIETWNMTVTPLKEIFETAEPEGYRVFDKKRTKIRLPDQPYMAIRLKKIQ